MARLIYASNMSLDGCTEDERGAFDWAPPDDEVFVFITELMRSAGTYLYGRRMYDTMAVWETDSTLAAQSDLTADYANAWQAADKVVYSSTLAVTSHREHPPRTPLRSEGGTRPEGRRQPGSHCGWPEPRGTGSRGRAGRRAPTVRLAGRPRWAQSRTADRHARRPRAPRRAPIQQRRPRAPLPNSVTRRENRRVEQCLITPDRGRTTTARTTGRTEAKPRGRRPAQLRRASYRRLAQPVARKFAVNRACIDSRSCRRQLHTPRTRPNCRSVLAPTSKFGHLWGCDRAMSAKGTTGWRPVRRLVHGRGARASRAVGAEGRRLRPAR